MPGTGLYSFGNGKLAKISSFKRTSGVFFFNPGCMKKKTMFCNCHCLDKPLIKTTKSPCMCLKKVDSTESVAWPLSLCLSPDAHRSISLCGVRCRHLECSVCGLHVHPGSVSALTVRCALLLLRLCLQGLCPSAQSSAASCSSDLTDTHLSYLQCLFRSFSCKYRQNEVSSYRML